MKTRFIFTAILLFLTTIAAQATSMDKVEMTVAKARAYLGSEAKLDAVHALQYRGNITLFQGKDEEGNDKDPLVGKVILSFEKSFSQKIEFIFEKQSLITGCDGYECYEYVQPVGQPVANIRSIGNDELRRNKAAAVENLSFFRPFSFDSTNIEDKGTQTVNGKQAHQINFIHNGKYIFSRYFDVSNGDLLKTVIDTGMVTYETGEIMVDGIRFSNKTVGELKGQTIYEMTFDEIIINPEFEPKMFDYPTF